MLLVSSFQFSIRHQSIHPFAMHLSIHPSIHPSILCHASIRPFLSHVSVCSFVHKCVRCHVPIHVSFSMDTSITLQYTHLFPPSLHPFILCYASIHSRILRHVSIYTSCHASSLLFIFPFIHLSLMHPDHSFHASIISPSFGIFRPVLLPSALSFNHLFILND